MRSWPALGVCALAACSRPVVALDGGGDAEVWLDGPGGDPGRPDAGRRDADGGAGAGDAWDFRDAGGPAGDAGPACTFPAAPFARRVSVAGACGAEPPGEGARDELAAVRSVDPLVIGFDDGAVLRFEGAPRVALHVGARVWAQVSIESPWWYDVRVVLRERAPAGRLIAAAWEGTQALRGPAGGIALVPVDEACAPAELSVGPQCGPLYSEALEVTIEEPGGPVTAHVPSAATIRAGPFDVTNALAMRYATRPLCSDTPSLWLAGTIARTSTEGLDLGPPPSPDAGVARPDGGFLDAGPGDFVQVSAGATHTCAVRASGAIACWGSNTHGESTPAPGVYDAVTAGQEHACGLVRGGEVRCWGAETAAPRGRFVQISAGSGFTCGVGERRNLACWGSHAPLPPPGTFTKVSAGAGWACAIRDDRTLTCFGMPLSDLGQTAAPPGELVDVSAGVERTCGVRTSSTVDCWGVGDRFCRPTPSGRYTTLSLGASYACGVRPDRTLSCEGISIDAVTRAPSGRVLQVDAGARHACAIFEGGAVVCWGDDAWGQATPR